MRVAYTMSSFFELNTTREAPVVQILLKNRGSKRETPTVRNNAKRSRKKLSTSYKLEKKMEKGFIQCY
jgi:hypothetical protein